VAGKLRLDLAQYRELATFAQFGTELDRASQAQLERGRRLTEVLKQDQFQPLPVEKQIIIIYAGNRGFLDEFPVEKIRLYEKRLYEFLDRERPEILRELREKKELTPELDAAIASALQEFNARFRQEIS
jgi:F-type H+-transporting ATPase subunit alpha